MNFRSIVCKKTVVSSRFRSVFTSSLVSMTLSYILMLTDNVVAGQFLGDAAVAAMSLVFPLLTILFFFSYLIADGLGMLAAYARGKEDRMTVNQLFSQGVMLSVGFGLILVLLLNVFEKEILSFWHISTEYMVHAQGYYNGLKWLPPVVFTNIFLYTFLIQDGEESVCVKASAGAFLSILCWIFFYVLGWVQGA